MKTYLVVFSLVPALASCGPLPGYYPDEEAPGAQAPPPPRPPTTTSPGTRMTAPGPAATPREPAPAPTPQPPTPPAAVAPARKAMMVLETGTPDMRYLIDTKRRLCFFQTRSALAPVPCASIPEAAAALGMKPSVPDATPAPAARPAPEAPPAEPPAPAASPEPSPPPAASRDPRAAPTVAERDHFERAYVQIFCDRRAGDTTEPAQRIQAEGLTVERYSAIESWAARDEQVWRELTRKAVQGCSQR